MPIYVYECQKCQKVFEIEQRITEDPLSTCDCGGQVKRLIQPTAVMFKGSGFHINDYNAPASPVTETKPESQPEVKPDPKPADVPKAPKPD